MSRLRFFVFWLLFAASCLCSWPVLAAYDLEVPVDPLNEYRMLFKAYSKHLLASYDRAFVDDYEGAVREVDKAIKLLPEEGIAYAERGKYYRMLNNSTLAEGDFNKALLLFERAIERYRPAGGKKTSKNGGRKVDPAEAARLITTLRYQRGECYFSFEKYRQATDDFGAACQGGNSMACSRIRDIRAIEKRGTHWVPISALQFYDRQRIERPDSHVVRAWLRREDAQPLQAESGAENFIQQHLELNCSTRESRLLEAFASSAGGQSASQKAAGPVFAKPSPGSAPAKLLILLCTRPPLK
ncbi:MAG: hypothetical protein H7Y05_05000 [Steroidobacteraceae bacterium]|nr:hypothetical protein [Deltaproteobacteria bacterium]